jgi:hypothetical protein
MYKLIFILLFIILPSFSSAELILHTPEIITVSSSDTRIPISIFNPDSSNAFTSVFRSSSGIEFASVINDNVFIDENSYGSFDVSIDADSVEPGVYFGEVSIYSSKSLTPIFSVPVIFGKESDLPRAFDVSIEFNEDLGISYINDELTLDSEIHVYKLDYNPTTLNNVVLDFYVYDLQGDLIDTSQDTVSVSTRSSFTKFTNLGSISPSEVVLVALVRSQGKTWLDVYQVPVKSDLYLSPPEDRTNYWLYLGIFSFLIASIIILSYFWNHKVAVQADEWKSELKEIKKYRLSDSNKALKKLNSQKEILQRAYSSHFISKSSYLEGMSSINKMMEDFEKRL